MCGIVLSTFLKHELPSKWYCMRVIMGNAQNNNLCSSLEAQLIASALMPLDLLALHALQAIWMPPH